MDTTNMVEAPVVAEVPANPTLADVMATAPDEAQQPEAAEVSAAPEQPRKEPGYLAGKRAEWEAAHRAEMDELRGQITVLQDYFVQQEADKLVASGKIADRDMAMEYLKLRGGQPQSVMQQATQSQPRDELGRFTAQQPEAQQRARDLYTQSQAIKRATGVDVMAIYNTDPEIRNRVLNGEMDFADVYETVKQPAPPPSPVRSSNGAGTRNVSIGKMSDAEFDRLNAMMAKGAKIDVR